MFQFANQQQHKEEKTGGSSFGDFESSDFKNLNLETPQTKSLMTDLEASIKRAEINRKNIQAANIAYAASQSQGQEQKQEKATTKSPCGCFGG